MEEIKNDELLVKILVFYTINKMIYKRVFAAFPVEFEIERKPHEFALQMVVKNIINAS